MVFSKVMPGTHKQLVEIYQKTDTSAFQATKTKLEDEIKNVQFQMLEAKTLTEYKQLKETELELNEQVLELEIKIRAAKDNSENVRMHDIPVLQERYNDEFKPFHKEYVGLDKELKKKLKKLSQEIGPLVCRMKEIEQLELSALSAKMTNGKAHDMDYLQLPIDRRSLDQESFGLFVKKESSLTDNVKRIVHQIEKLD